MSNPALTRDKLRQLTLGSTRSFTPRKVVLRDASKPRVLEKVLDENGKVVLEQELDERGEVKFDAEGNEVFVEKERYRHPPLIGEDGGEVFVEVKPPSVKQRGRILELAMDSKTKLVDPARLQVEAVIALTYAPGTEIKTFDDRDREALLARPTGDFVDDIFEVIGPMLNTEEADEIARKNSKRTATA